jgi:CRISPR/Cas system-associated exonuclease Cas4 (RecB family)
MATLEFPLEELASTKEWTPPTGEMRPSSLGACPRYAWQEVRKPQEDRVLGPIGREVMLYSGHAAEERFIELAREVNGELICHGQTLNNGYGGECHPDGVDYTLRRIIEIKFTGYAKPAPYHLAQLNWYQYRMSLETGGAEWEGEVVLLDKYGKEPKRFLVPFPDADRIAELTERAEAQVAPIPPKGMCENRAQATTKARYYDAETPCGQRTEISCPYADLCFPAGEDDFQL